MQIRKLFLSQYRNYEKVQIDFDSDVIFFTGKNASGKTNLIEAISYFSLGKSFRGSGDSELIRKGSAGAHFACQYEREGSIFKLEVSLPKKGTSGSKKIRHNGKPLSGRAELIGKILTVIISPSDLDIIERGPPARRKFLDLILSTKNPEYLKNLIIYTRSLKQRNAVLRNIKLKKAQVSDLKSWEKDFIRSAIFLIEERKSFVQNFHTSLQKILFDISGGNDRIQFLLRYADELEARDFSKALESSLEKDLWKGFTTIGPHRHSLEFIVNENPIEHYGSQGQKRSLVLALRISQFYYLKEELKIAPILLIDDVIRELDQNRRNAFVGLIQDCGQAFFTTPDMDGLDLLKKNVNYEIFHLEEPAKLKKLV